VDIARDLPEVARAVSCGFSRAYSKWPSRHRGFCTSRLFGPRS